LINREEVLSLALMNKIFNYQKNGPGVSKADGRTGNTKGFWRIYKDKFFQLLGLNLIFCLCLVIVLLLSWIPLNSVLNDKSDFSDTLKNEYNIESGIVSAFDRMVDAYKIDDNEISKAFVHFEKAIDVINKNNKEALSKRNVDGVLEGFDSTKYEQAELAYIADEIIKGLEKLDFSVKIADGVGYATYTLSDSADNEVACITYTYGKDKQSDSVMFEHYFPYSVSRFALIILCFAPLILLGPVKLGLTRLTRDYVREEPTFMLSDLWDTFKKNWWQSFVISFIEYIATGCAILALIWYYTYINSGIFFIIGFAGCLFLSYVFISMHFYVPMMQVTLDLNLRKIYKNAFFFTVICMLKNVGMILLGAALLVATFVLLFIFGQAYYLVTSLTVTVLLIMGFSFWFYFVSYNTFPAIKKYVIDPYYNEQNKSDESDEENQSKQQVAESNDDVAATSVFENDNNDDDLPEYVYHNGRMVHRSVLEQQNLFDDDVK